jgi:hypothetical protein
MTITDGSENTMMRFGKNISEMDKSFDIEYWQRQTSADWFAAVWEMVKTHHLRKGESADELRLQRTVEHFQRNPRVEKK